jgi:hypothetical protein
MHKTEIGLFCAFIHLGFVLVSDFVLRISDFPGGRLC